MHEQRKRDQENMPITYVDPFTGYEFPIPELIERGEYEALDAKRRQMKPKSPPQKAPSLEDFEEYEAAAEQDSSDFILNGDDKAVEDDITRLLDITDIPLPLPEQVIKLPTVANAGTGQKLTSSAASEVRVKLPPNWKIGNNILLQFREFREFREFRSSDSCFFP